VETGTHVKVGPAGADFLGDTHRAVQSAVDYVAQLGGGTVEVLPGTYRLGNAVHLRSRVRLVGNGSRTVLWKSPSVTTPLTDDTDWYESRVTVADANGFEVGGGLLLQGRHVHGQGRTFTKHTILGIRGNELLLDSQPRQNLWITHEATASTLFPMVTGNSVHDIAVENLAINGNRDENGRLDGNYGGCIFLQDCQRVVIAGVQATNNNGDGISWQVCDDVRVEDCTSAHHANLGLHPGSGSQRPVIRRNTVRDCSIGLFWCWGVRYGVAEENDIQNIREWGISIGHRDTDNVMRRNLVANCGRGGLLFRAEEPAIRASHRNVVEENTFRDMGGAEVEGVGIDVVAAVRGVVLRRNRIADTRGAMACGVRIGPNVEEVLCEGNTFEGVREEVRDERRVPEEAAG
jgi:hypothetical protein